MHSIFSCVYSVPKIPKKQNVHLTSIGLCQLEEFVELYGFKIQKDFTRSIKAIEELTKRNTGEYAIRPYARAYPERRLTVCTRWAQKQKLSSTTLHQRDFVQNFHGRQSSMFGIQIQNQF